jgi:hypothetical protein
VVPFYGGEAMRMMATTKRSMAPVSFMTALGVIGVLACPSRTEGPPLCSAEGLGRLRDAGGGDGLMARLCPDQAPRPSTPIEDSAAGPWKSPPVAPSRIKTDPVTYLEKPVVISVAVRPADYFNYGYRNARESHFSFEIAQLETDNNVRPLSLYGYADRRWARPFFEEVTRELEAAAGEYQFARATLVVMYKRSRYESSPDHLEILAASRGEDRSLTPESREVAGNDAGTVAGHKPSVAGAGTAPEPRLADAATVGPPDEQVVRDARPYLAQWRGLMARVAEPTIARKTLDQFEKDRCDAVVEARVTAGGGDKTIVKVFLTYRRNADFWKLTEGTSRIY